MINKLKLSYAKFGAVAAGVAFAFSADSAEAANNLTTLSTNVIDQMANIPGILSAVAYITGVILIVLGIMKVKEHVAKPDQTPLKEGAIMLFAGGALFAAPYIMDVFQTSISADSAGADVNSNIKAVTWTP